MVSVKKLIRNSGISQRKLAKAIHVTPPVISYFMNHDEIGYSAASAIAEYFSVSLDECKEFVGIKKRQGKQLRKTEELEKSLKCLKKDCPLNRKEYCQSPYITARKAKCMNYIGYR